MILLIILGIILLIGLAIVLNKIPRKFHLIIKLVLIALIGLFSYNLFQSIAEPVRFQEVKEERYKKVIANLIKLREAENAHKTILGRYTDNIEALATFIDTAQFALIEKRDSSVADREKNKRFGLDADNGGYYKEITIVDTLGFRSVKDSLFANTDVRSLLNYPIEGAPGKIVLEKGAISDDELVISVFQATASKKDILWDQPEKLVEQELNIRAVEAVDGPHIIVGSLSEVSTSGNWPRQYAIDEEK
jgi:hypothetical protein